MKKNYFSLSDIPFQNKTVGIRIDINTRVENGKIIENRRFLKHAETIKHLLENNAKVVILAHQGRKGEKDFTSLREHAKILEKYVENIKFIDKIIDEEVKEEIKNLKSGECLLLENVRFLEDETLKRNVVEHANSTIVKFLSPLIDYYVLDAFSVAHRSHASVVGFATQKPMVAGLLFEKEKNAFDKALNPLGINTWIFGGAKIDDCIKVMKFLFEEKPGVIERVLTGGLLANLFLKVSGYEIGKGSKEILKKKGYLELEKVAEELLKKYKKEIILPIDVAIEENGNRKEVDINEIPENSTILDIGSKTVETYKKVIEESRSVVFKGPVGLYEKKGFEIGTKLLFEFLENFDGFTLIGGGDTSLALFSLGFNENKFSYVSVSGGAMISYLAGEELPGIRALEISYQKFKDKI